MKRAIRKPPPVLNAARVLQYVFLDNSIGFAGRTGIFVDGKELGKMPCLAICQPLTANAGTEFLLDHCSRDWRVLGCAGYDSLTAAKAAATRIYPRVSGRWVKTNVTKRDAKRYLDRLWNHRRCSFCGKRPYELGQLISKKGIRICDSCVTEFYEMIRESSAVGPGMPAS